MAMLARREGRNSWSSSRETLVCEVTCADDYAEVKVTEGHLIPGNDTPPIYMLPEDVLQEIFILCLPSSRFPTLDRFQAPLLLTQVCKSWRSTAINSPFLWSRIDICIPSLRNPSRPRQAPTIEDRVRFKVVAISFGQAIERWVSRIGGYPLSFGIHQDDNYELEEDKICRDVLSTLLKRSHIWRFANLHVPLRNADDVVKRASDEFGMLEALAINCSSRSKLGQPAKLIPLFPFPIHSTATASPGLRCWNTSRVFEAPALRSLSLTSIDEPIISLNVDWSRLTQLVIEKQGSFADFGPIDALVTLDIPALVALLRQCTHLERLRVALTPRARTPLPDHAELSTPLFLPNLSTLQLNEDRSCTIPFFEILEAPSLRHFEFQTLQQPKYTTLPWSPLPFVVKHGNQIEELTIDYRYVRNECRGATLFEPLLGLKRLRLRQSTFAGVKYPGHDDDLVPFQDEDLRSLIPTLTTREGGDKELRVLCPKLEEIEGRDQTRLSDTALMAFIGNTDRVSLKKFSATCLATREKTVCVEEAIKRCEEQGVKLAVALELRPSFVGPDVCRTSILDLESFV